MAEIGVIASIVQIADLGLRLSLKLYTFGEAVSSADKSIISISKDVSLTSSVLKELGHILGKDQEDNEGLCSENAVQTADGIVKECLQVFKEVENTVVKKVPHLSRGDNATRATIALERMKWPFVQPRLQLLQSNLDRLKSTLLLMLNVFIYARQVSERARDRGIRSEASEVAAQRVLIEDLAHSNEEYIRKFESLKLSVRDDSSQKSIDRSEPTATLGPRYRHSEARSLDETLFTSADVDASSLPPTGTSDMPINVLFSPLATSSSHIALKQVLAHYDSLMNKLIREVLASEYEIPSDSRSRIRADIIVTHGREKRQFRNMHGQMPGKGSMRHHETVFHNEQPGSETPIPAMCSGYVQVTPHFTQMQPYSPQESNCQQMMLAQRIGSTIHAANAQALQVQGQQQPNDGMISGDGNPKMNQVPFVQNQIVQPVPLTPHLQPQMVQQQQQQQFVRMQQQSQQQRSQQNAQQQAQQQQKIQQQQQQQLAVMQRQMVMQQPASRVASAQAQPASQPPVTFQSQIPTGSDPAAAAAAAVQRRAQQQAQMQAQQQAQRQQQQPQRNQESQPDPRQEEAQQPQGNQYYAQLQQRRLNDHSPTAQPFQFSLEQFDDQLFPEHQPQESRRWEMVLSKTSQQEPMVPLSQQAAILPLWRRDESGQTNCNNWELNHKLHGVHRLGAIKKPVTKLRRRVVPAANEEDPNASQLSAFSVSQTPAPQRITSPKNQGKQRYPSSIGHQATNASTTEPLDLEAPKKPICWDQDCNGCQFSTFSQLLRHQRERSGGVLTSVGVNCGAQFTRKTAREGHQARATCEPRFVENWHYRNIEPVKTTQDKKPNSRKRRRPLASPPISRIRSFPPVMSDAREALEPKCRLSVTDQPVSPSPSEHPLPEGNENIVDYLVALWTLLPLEHQAK